MVPLMVFLLRTKLANSASPTTVATTPSTEADSATAVVTAEVCSLDEGEEERERGS